MAYQRRGSSKYKRSKDLPPVTKQPRFTPPGGWNKESKAVFKFIEDGKGHGAIEAVAGGGKTTTVVESAIRVCEKFPHAKVLFVAFNVSIKEEGQKRLAGYNVDVMTCHGLGHRTIMKPSAWGGPDGRAQFDVQGSTGDYMMSLAENELGYEKEKRDDREALLDLIGKAKTCLVNDVEGMLDLMERFGIESTYPREELAESALKIMEYNREKPRMIQVEGRGRSRGRKFSKIALTFDDQCWLPIVNDWKVEQYDVVFVDEAQDLSPARRELIRKALKPGGRLFVVGDRYQAIYGFAGADIDSLPTLIEEFDCKVLPLSYSWRCAPAIVAEAQQFNPNIQANPAKVGVDDGIVDTSEAGDLLDALKPGEVLLSRTNAPLVRVFFQLARRQVKVKFIGRDYGKMLAYRIKGWKFRHENAVMKGHASGPFTGRLMLEYNDEWLQTQGRNRSKNPDDEDDDSGINDRMRDEHATVIALTIDLASSLDSEGSMKEILDRCFAFSPEEKPGEDSGQDYVTLSSTHRFKGLERDHAHVLIDTYKPGVNQEEVNLVYVAVTRAKKHLTYVNG